MSPSGSRLPSLSSSGPRQPVLPRSVSARMSGAGTMECPFCGFWTTNDYQITLHVEQLHIVDSPFAAKDDESLALALALQREEEEAAAAISASSQNTEISPALAPSTSYTTQSGGEHAYDVANDSPYAECPYSDCDEFVHLSGFNEHLDLHALSDPSLEADSIITIANNMNDGHKTVNPGPSLTSHATKGSTPDHAARENLPPLRGISSSESKISRTISPYLDSSSREKRPKGTLKGTGDRKRQPVRLGVGELGPYAHEERMPNWLIEQLRQGGPVSYVNRIGVDGKLVKEAVVENEVPGTVPVLARLCALSDTLETAYLCHPCVQHIFKRKSEGGFCGYRNIQMLLSYIIGTRAKGHEKFGDRVPNVLQIQDMIEDAWDEGFGSLGKVELGGVRNTRKWIGTPEALVVFRYLNLEVDCQSFSGSRKNQKAAHARLFDAIESYFTAGSSDTGGKVRKTYLPPIYFQRPSHSLTIVGFERHRNGDRNLLVFDPAFGLSRGVQQLLRDPVGHSPTKVDAKNLLQNYRRGGDRLDIYDEFEILFQVHADPTVPV